MMIYGGGYMLPPFLIEKGNSMAVVIENSSKSVAKIGRHGMAPIVLKPSETFKFQNDRHYQSYQDSVEALVGIGVLIKSKGSDNNTPPAPKTEPEPKPEVKSEEKAEPAKPVKKRGRKPKKLVNLDEAK